MNEARLLELRAQKDEFFKAHPQSPLTPEQQARFSGLAYFAPAAEWSLVVEVQPFEQKENVLIQHTKGDAKWFMRYGEFEFAVNGSAGRLTIFRTADYFFLPFVDVLAGQETYGAGRYLEPVPLADGRFAIDFNQAYNPYCAYNDRWACPITPAENRLSVAIRAGEKLPSEAWL